MLSITSTDFNFVGYEYFTVGNQEERLNVLVVQKEILNTLNEGKKIKKDITELKNSEPYRNYADKYGEMIDKCESLLTKCIELKEMELNMLSSYVNNAVSVGKYNSTPYVLIVKPSKGEVVPTEIIDIKEFKF